MPDVRDAVTDGEISLGQCQDSRSGFGEGQCRSGRAGRRPVGARLPRCRPSSSPGRRADGLCSVRTTAARASTGGSGLGDGSASGTATTAWFICAVSWTPLLGAKMRTRLLKEAERLRRCDVGNPGGEQRTLPQRLVDALETLTAPSGSADGHWKQAFG